MSGDRSAGSAPVLDVPALLARHAGRKVYFDTHIFIYVLNGTPDLSVPCVQLLDACAQGAIQGITGWCHTTAPPSNAPPPCAPTTA
jgi:hypothetical protein